MGKFIYSSFISIHEWFNFLRKTKPKIKEFNINSFHLWIELLSYIWNILPIHRFFMGERQNIMQRIYKYNSERKRKRCWHGPIPKNSKDYVCVHFRGAFEWNKSLINVAKCYADCITKCVAAYGIVCFIFSHFYPIKKFFKQLIFVCEIPYYFYHYLHCLRSTLFFLRNFYLLLI